MPRVYQMDREAELVIIRRANAEQMLATVSGDDPYVEVAFAEVRRENLLDPGPSQVIRWYRGYVATPTATGSSNNNDVSVPDASPMELQIGDDMEPTEHSVELISTITCPRCGHQATETMPTDACVYIYQCKSCGHTMKPKRGDCCVFCSYGSAPCPPIQTNNSCCAGVARHAGLPEVGPA
jgi:hypothetical protein